MSRHAAPCGDVQRGAASLWCVAAGMLDSMGVRHAAGKPAGVLQALLCAGARCDAAHAAHHAAANGNVMALEVMLEAGADVNAR